VDVHSFRSAVEPPCGILIVDGGAGSDPGM